jgi:hypothetical protein
MNQNGNGPNFISVLPNVFRTKLVPPPLNRKRCIHWLAFTVR